MKTQIVKIIFVSSMIVEIKKTIYVVVTLNFNYCELPNVVAYYHGKKFNNISSR